MDTTSSSTAIHSFSSQVPLQHTTTIIHFVALSIAFLGCYPYAFTQKNTSRQSHKRRLIPLGLGYVLTLVGFITGWFVQYSSATTISVKLLHSILCFLLFILTTLQCALDTSWYHHICITEQEQHDDHYMYWLYSKLRHVPEAFTLLLQCLTLYLGYFYVIYSVLVLTSTCTSLGHCWVPVATGSGFLLYGSLAFMHLIGVVILPRHSSPEYYEAIWMLLWSCFSFIWWDTPLLGSSWKTINLALLWMTGSLLSLTVTLQSWVPFLQKRNIINCVILFLTGFGILSSYTEDNAYMMELNATLGYILILGSIARCIQIVFRKSTTDNLPRLYTRALGTYDATCVDEDMYDDDTCVDELEIGHQRASDFETAYRQLTGTSSSATTATISRCKHQSVYASITIVCGLLCSFMAIAGGCLFVGSTVEWVETIRYHIDDPTTYINVLLAVSFLWTTYILIMCSLYKSSIKPSGYYDYLDLPTGEHCDLPMSSKSTSSLSTFVSHRHSHSATMMTTVTSSSSHDVGNQQGSFTMVPLLPLTVVTNKHQHHPPVSAPLSASASNGSSASAPPMRPSQYRAKRRSLLISTSMQSNSNNGHHQEDRARRTLSASSYSGVGGILPDEALVYDGDYVFSPMNIHARDKSSLKRSSSSSSSTSSNHCTNQQQQHQEQQKQQQFTQKQQRPFSPSFQRRSWRSTSSVSSVSTSTSTSSSCSVPNLGTSITTATESSTASNKAPSHRDSWQQQQYEQQYIGNEIYKTESGKRKERQWKKSKRRRAVATKNDYNLSDEPQAPTPSSGSDDRGRYQYYSSERNSSDSHV